MGRGGNKSLGRAWAMEWPVLFIRDRSLVVICDGQSYSQHVLALHPIPRVKHAEIRDCKNRKPCKMFRKFFRCRCACCNDCSCGKAKQRNGERAIGHSSAQEVLSLGEMEGFNVDMELPLPDLLEPSEILTEEHIKELHNIVPNRAKGYPWTRIYSTSKDGFNLKSLYRKMSNYDCPVLLIIQDTDHAVFGALLSHPLRPSDKFYGTGESFLFTFHPSFKEFKWTGENDYFINGNTDSVSIGASDGHFGLWFDSDLNRGSSNPCLTFSNEVLASGSDFQINILEAWGFN